MQLPEHVEGIRDALAAFVDYARRAGLEARVPTAPDWNVRELIAHQGMVHRWATAHLRGEPGDPDEFEGLRVEDPLLWLHEGGLALVEAILAAPDDLEAMVFLEAAPPPRQFWARRQCHETTIHAVDALSAALGRIPRPEETWIRREVALDGIDELVTGFVTRRHSELRSERPVTFAVRPEDAEQSWTVRVTTDPAVTERHPHGHVHGDVDLDGTAVALYLALWNRCDTVDAEDFELWRERSRVTWA